MKTPSLNLMVLCIGSALAFPGCSQKVDANKELQKAADAFAARAPAPAASTPAQPTPQIQSTPAAPTQPPAQELTLAMTAYKSGQLEDAITRLQNLRSQIALSPQQRMALQDAIAAVMTEVNALAAKGDARAIQAIKQYERMQTQR